MRRILLFLCFIPAAGLLAAASQVTVSGRQLLVRQRLSDNSLGPQETYVIRGVAWSPADISTTGDPSSRRPVFVSAASTDIPLLAGLHVNTIRTYIAFDATSQSRAVLDQLYAQGIMVIMTVDDGNDDTSRITTTVNYYKDHPAILMWLIGNEWNYNHYYSNATELQSAQMTESAAQLVKSLDSAHPVATSYGDPASANTSTYVNATCPSVDLWGFNVYRGNTFGTLFDDWKAMSTKPMFVSEFGTDAVRTTSNDGSGTGVVDETMQSDWDLSEWNDLIGHLSAKDPNNAALGGVVFEFNDEWWKAGSPSTHDMGGFALTGGAPDNFANEEYFGLVDLNRQPRAAYTTLEGSFAPPAPASLDARYNGGATALTWGSVSQATSYEVSRSDDGQTYAVVGTPSVASFTDGTVASGHAYLYRVRSVNSFGSTSSWTTPNLTTAVSFTGDPIVVQSTKVSAVHVTELRTAVNAVRALAAMGTATYTNSVVSGATVHAADVSELRTALAPALSALGLPAISYAHATLQPNVSPISAIDLQELRDAIR